MIPSLPALHAAYAILARIENQIRAMAGVLLKNKHHGVAKKARP